MQHELSKRCFTFSFSHNQGPLPTYGGSDEEAVLLLGNRLGETAVRHMGRDGFYRGGRPAASAGRADFCHRRFQACEGCRQMRDWERNAAWTGSNSLGFERQRLERQAERAERAAATDEELARYGGDAMAWLLARSREQWANALERVRRGRADARAALALPPGQDSQPRRRATRRLPRTSTAVSRATKLGRCRPSFLRSCPVVRVGRRLTSNAWAWPMPASIASPATHRTQRLHLTSSVW